MSNYVTERQARDMRCCGPDGCGRAATLKTKGGYIYWTRYCIGPDCMGWLWGRSSRKVQAAGAPSVGYCGLAGRPEE